MWAVMILGGLLGSPSVPAAPAGDGSTFKSRVRPLLEKYCFDCHGEDVSKAKLDLSSFKDEPAVFEAWSTWERVARRVRDGEMPPRKKRQPSAAERKLLARWFSEAAGRFVKAAPKDPGRIGFRRLNRTEYNNTTRDLFGVDLKPGDALPADDSAHGFDTIAESLTLPPILVEKYILAAERMLDQILLPDPVDRRIEAETLKPQGAQNGTVVLNKGEGLQTDIEFPSSGRYLLRVRGHKTNGAKARISFELDGKRMTQLEVRDQSSKAPPVEASVLVAPGKKRLRIQVTEGGPVRVDRLEIAGPTGPRGAKEAKSRIFFVKPGKGTAAREAAKKIVGRFANRAFRRPVNAKETERYLAIYDAAVKRADGFEAAVRLPLTAILCSPYFLFRVEADRPGETKPWRLSDHELAVRLSYFLWSTMPDDRLRELAGQGKLSEAATLEAEVKRMLADPRSQALVDNFFRAWLGVNAFKHKKPDNRLFRDFNKDWRLRRGMEEEITRFVQELLREDRSVLEIIDADYTYVNGALAKWYGLQGFEGRADRTKKVALRDRRRGGLLTMGGVLVMTSSPDRTSVVKRGVWILERMLGTPPPPPPPDVEAELKREGKRGEPAKKTLRERMEAHRTDPQCASCHGRFDPLGFGLENYDAVGRWRDTEAGKPVDATGTLPDGRTFSGPVALKDLLLGRKEEFVRNVAEKLLIYGLGRGLRDADIPAVLKIVETSGTKEYRFSALVAEIVKSYPFQYRRNARAEGDAR